MTTQERYWAKVEIKGADECWPWKAGLSGMGYGNFWANGRMMIASRYSLELKLGRALERGEHALHTCDNPLCQNPAHLFLGSPRDNAVDRESKGRGGHVCGDANGSAKLTKSDIAGIKELRKRGWIHKSIAGAYRISGSQVGKILSGQYRNREGGK